MNRLSADRQAAILRALCEGNSIRATCRLTGAAKATVLKLLVEVGEFCSGYQDWLLRNLKTERVEADEIWAFVGAKRRRALRDGDGDIWTYTAIDADSKLMISWLVGARTTENATEFMHDLRSRISGRIQLTTDGHPMYFSAVRSAFGYEGVDWGTIVKHYGTDPEKKEAHRYSLPACTGVTRKRELGDPNVDLISTSYVERSNLTLRMQQRRFTRLTNAFSKKAENHVHAVSLFFMHYSFCRAHQTLTKANGGVHTSPAMAAGLTTYVWKIEDILRLMDPSAAVVH